MSKNYSIDIKRYAEVFDIIGDAVSIQDRNYKILYQNDIHIGLVGNHIGKYCYKAYEKRNLRCDGCPVAVSFKDGCRHKARRSAPVGDTIIHVEITSSPIKDSEGNIIAGVELVRDITARKQAEEALLKNEAELEAIIENSPCGITISDIDGHILRTNPAHQRISGYSLAELQTMTFADFTHPDDIGKNLELYKELLAGNIAQFNMTKRFIHKDGHTIWTQVKLSLILDNNNPALVVGIVEDITEQKKQEMVKDALIEKLQKSTEEIKNLQGIIPICMHCKQIRDDKGFWSKVERYIEHHTDAKFSHGVCPDCVEEHYSEIVKPKNITSGIVK